MCSNLFILLVTSFRKAEVFCLCISSHSVIAFFWTVSFQFLQPFLFQKAFPFSGLSWPCCTFVSLKQHHTPLCQHPEVLDFHYLSLSHNKTDNLAQVDFSEAITLLIRCTHITPKCLSALLLESNYSSFWLYVVLFSRVLVCFPPWISSFCFEFFLHLIKILLKFCPLQSDCNSSQLCTVTDIIAVTSTVWSKLSTKTLARSRPVGTDLNGFCICQAKHSWLLYVYFFIQLDYLLFHLNCAPLLSPEKNHMGVCQKQIYYLSFLRPITLLHQGINVVSCNLVFIVLCWFLIFLFLLLQN